jgi:hypothetical protein
MHTERTSCVLPICSEAMEIERTNKAGKTLTAAFCTHSILRHHGSGLLGSGVYRSGPQVPRTNRIVRHFRREVAIS